MKGHFNDHNFFSKLVFNAFKAYQLDVWLQTTKAMDEGGIGGDDLLWRPHFMHFATYG
jgi:hypothetical protein